MMANDALRIPDGGAPFTLNTSAGPAAKAIEYTNWDESLANARADDEPKSPSDLGRLRIEVMRRLACLPDDESEPSDDIKLGLFRLAAESVKAIGALAQAKPKPALLWNEELDPATFLGRTLLLADHVVAPDAVFSSLVQSGTCGSLRRAAKRELEFAELYLAGLVVLLPAGVAMATRGDVAIKSTRLDLADPALVSWVRDQLILEGPTAREALFVRALDDLSQHADKFWLHSRIDPDSLDEETRRFTTRMLLPYESKRDYGPWIRQVSDSAVSWYVQRTNERVVTADVFGADYVSASMFEARLLRRRRGGDDHGAPQAAMWADVPLLPDLKAPDLVKLLRNEDAVEDLRRSVRASLATARTPGDRTDGLTDLAHDLEASSHRLGRAAATDRIWQGVAPGGFGFASLVIGAHNGGLGPIAAGTAGLLAGLAPYLGARMTTRREAAYLFVTARRRKR
ncbi:hypothetical protein [Mycolicibacterium sp. A43C]